MLLRFTSLLRGLLLSRFAGRSVSLIDPAHVGGFGEPKRATPAPDGFAYIHIFCAKFDDAAAARKFCYDTPTINTPEEITKELSGAFINTEFVEVIFGNIAQRLDEFMADGDSVQVVSSLGPDNTVILITEDAFGGFPFVVHSTKTLTYLGKFTVPV